MKNLYELLFLLCMKIYKILELKNTAICLVH